MRFERDLAKAIPQAAHGQWFEFRDANGPGNCQCDLLLVGQKRVAIIEAKLTDVDGGRAQLANLYFPIAQMVWPEKRPLGIVAARHLSRESDLTRVVTTLHDAILWAEKHRQIPTLHWMGNTPLL